MSVHSAAINAIMLRCTLRALIHLAGEKFPPTMKAHPVVEQVPLPQLAGYVDTYTSFLRRYQA